jgi:hypothetical protein
MTHSTATKPSALDQRPYITTEVIMIGYEIASCNACDGVGITDFGEAVRIYGDTHPQVEFSAADLKELRQAWKREFPRNRAYVA